MDYKYYDLPFGAQLLLWTSRIFYNGSCRTTPNKYEIIDLAYKKVGIHNGSKLLKGLLNILKNIDKFKIQKICNQCLTESEINLICCIEEHKNENINNSYYIDLWKLGAKRELFTYNAVNLANQFKKVNLNTDIFFKYNRKIKIENLNTINNTLH